MGLKIFLVASKFFCNTAEVVEDQNTSRNALVIQCAML